MKIVRCSLFDALCSQKEVNAINNNFNNWRYYRLGKDEYKTCMETAFYSNIIALRWVNLVFFILTILFSVFSVITEHSFNKAVFYIGTALVALFIFIIACRLIKKLQDEIQINRGFIYFLIFLYYFNVMFLGLYLAVWAEPDKIAGSFIGIYICALFVFNISPLLYTGLTLGTLVFYIITIINFKNPLVWNFDIQNALFAAAMGIIFGWQIIMNRITMISSAKKLREGSTIDELTDLKNRRDFMNTFQRYLSNQRQSENYLCIAIINIDYFKKYNDYYGHFKGDECLRKIGKVLNSINKTDGIYAARIGGEEFALLWHAVRSIDANNVGNRINQIIRDINIPHEKSKAAPYVTVSIGIHTALCNVYHDIKDLYNLAEKALNEAKDSGRNCTVVSGD